MSIKVRKIRDKEYGQKIDKFVEYSSFAHLEVDSKCILVMLPLIIAIVWTPTR